MGVALKRVVETVSSTRGWLLQSDTTWVGLVTLAMDVAVKRLAVVVSSVGGSLFRGDTTGVWLGILTTGRVVGGAGLSRWSPCTIGGVAVLSLWMWDAAVGVSRSSNRGWGRVKATPGCRSLRRDAGSPAMSSWAGDLFTAARAAGGEVVVRDPSLVEVELFNSGLTTTSTRALSHFSLGRHDITISQSPQQRVLFFAADEVGEVQCPLVRRSVSSWLLFVSTGRGTRQRTALMVVVSEAVIEVTHCRILVSGNAGFTGINEG